VAEAIIRALQAGNGRSNRCDSEDLGVAPAHIGILARLLVPVSRTEMTRRVSDMTVGRSLRLRSPSDDLDRDGGKQIAGSGIAQRRDERSGLMHAGEEL
jgi:hypothetical protein